MDAREGLGYLSSISCIVRATTKAGPSAPS